MSPKEKLFKVLKAKDPILAPGAWDALSAKMIERVGFETCFLTGGGMTATMLGKPDFGMISLTEMTGQVRRICEAIQIPAITDGDSGFGNALNAMRTVTEMESAGAAAVAIQDKVEPANHQEGEMYPLDVAVKKLKASVKGIRRGEIAIVARTDEADVDAVIRRGKAYVKVGAELLFPHGAPNSFAPSDLRKIADSVGVPTMVNLQLLRGEKEGEQPTLDDFRGSMANILLFPREAFNAGIAASMNVLKQLKRDGRVAMKPEEALGKDLPELLEMQKWSRWTAEYLPKIEK